LRFQHGLVAEPLRGRLGLSLGRNVLAIQIKENRHCRLDLYNLSSHPIGAFAVGPTFEERTYRRGGNSARMLAILENVYAESTMQKMPSQ